MPGGVVVGRPCVRLRVLLFYLFGFPRSTSLFTHSKASMRAYSHKRLRTLDAAKRTKQNTVNTPPAIANYASKGPRVSPALKKQKGHINFTISGETRKARRSSCGLPHSFPPAVKSVKVLPTGARSFHELGEAAELLSCLPAPPRPPLLRVMIARGNTSTVPTTKPLRL